MVKDREVGCTAVHGVTKSWNWLSDWTKLVEVIEIQLSCFKSSKMILLKCYTQYDSKLGECYDPMDIGNLIFGSSAVSKSNSYIYNFSAHVLLKPSLNDFEYYLAGVWNEFNCTVVWTFFGIVLVWNWNVNWPFQSCGHCWVFKICCHIECSTLTESSFRIWNSSAGFQSPPLALFIVMLPSRLPRWSTWDAGDIGSIPGSGRSPGGGPNNPLKYSCLENPMDRGVWQATVHRVTESWTRLKWLSTHNASIGKLDFTLQDVWL